MEYCERVWWARHEILDTLDHLPHVPSHGDALPRNILRADPHRGRVRVLAVDCGQLGHNVVGADLSTLSLYSSVGIDVLLDAYTDGLGARADRIGGDVIRSTTVRTAALIAVSRASSALARDRNAEGYLRRLGAATPFLAEVASGL